MTAWLLIGATLATLYAFWIALNWTFDLIEWARKMGQEKRVLFDRGRAANNQSSCSCSRHWVDSRCPIHGWQYRTNWGRTRRR